MRKKWMSKGIMVCMTLILLLNSFTCGALAAETLDVKIPVIARGADCVAVLLNQDGGQIGEPLTLIDGEENYFTVTCEGMGRTVYTIRLTGEGDENVTYDTTVYEAAVTLYYSPSGALRGLLEIRYSGDMAAPKKEIAEFENVAQIAPVWIDPPVQKRVEGNPETDETFTFVLTAVSNTAGLEAMPMPNGAEAQTATMQIIGEGQKEFGRIEFTESGTYVYEVTEQRTDAEGYTFDATVYTVTAVVTLQDNSLSVETTIARNGDSVNEIVFTNVYEKPVADVKIEKETTSTPANGMAYVLGETITYKLTVTNTGNVDLTNVVVKDSKTGLNTVLAELKAGESIALTDGEYNLHYVVTEADVEAGTVHNVATVKADNPGKPDDPLEDEDDEDNPTEKRGVKIEKETVSTPANGTAYVLGETITYKLTVTNTGNVDLTNVEVKDSKTGLSTVLAELKAGESIALMDGEYNLHYVVTEADVEAGNVHNVATVKTENPGKPDEPLEDEDDEDNPTEKRGVKIEKETVSTPANGTAYVLGETITYKLTVTNTGSVDLTNVEVKDSKTGLNTVLAELKAGESVALTDGEYNLHYVVTEADVEAGNVHNVATVKTENPGKPNESLEDEDDEDNPTEKRGVKIEKETTSTPANGTAYVLGETITYKLTVTNTGSVDLTNVEVKDSKTGLNTVLPELKAGESIALTDGEYNLHYVVTEADVEAGTVHNVATVKTENPGKPNESLEDEDDEDNPTEKRGVKIEKETTSTPANGTAYVLGETISYKLTVTNTGNVDLTNVEVKDSKTGLNTVLAELKAGESVALTDGEYNLHYLVTEADVEAGNVHNVATVKTENPGKPDDPLEDEDEVDDPTTKTKSTTSPTPTITPEPGPGTSPRTSDERNLAFWIGSSVAVLCVILALMAYFIWSKRKDKRFK